MLWADAISASSNPWSFLAALCEGLISWLKIMHPQPRNQRCQEIELDGKHWECQDKIWLPGGKKRNTISISMNSSSLSALRTAWSGSGQYPNLGVWRYIHFTSATFRNGEVSGRSATALKHEKRNRRTWGAQKKQILFCLVHIIKCVCMTRLEKTKK